MNEIQLVEVDDNSKYLSRPISIIEFAGNLDDFANNKSIADNFNIINPNNINENKGRMNMMIKSMAQYLKLTNPINWVFLAFFSVVISLIFFIFDFLLEMALDFRFQLCSGENSILNMFLWIISCIVLLLIASSVGYFISPDADGSGIPEVKTVLSGISIYRYFSVEAFVGKFIGLFAALVGGASVGKVGPFVHLSAIVCSRLMKIKLFSNINNSTSAKNSMISAAAAAGVTLALGTPLGGVIFSLEVTSSFYIMSNIPKAFFCSTLCIVISKFIGSLRSRNLFNSPEHLSPINDTVLLFDVIFFILLGIICGIIGAFLATTVSKLAYIRRKSKFKFLNNRFYYTIIVAIIISIISFNVKPLMIFDRYILGKLFNINFPKELADLNHGNEGILLLSLSAFKLLITVLCLAMNIPTGIFAPFFVIGAYFGRFYGHFFKTIFTLSEEPIYAMVGAACIMSGATHSISSAIIIFELTGQKSYLLPMLFACLISNLTAQAFSISFFDVFLLMKNLPHLPSIKSNTLYGLTVEKIMSKELYPVTINKTNYLNMLQILLKIPKKYARNIPIPILDENQVILMTIKAKKLANFITNSMNLTNLIDNESQDHLRTVFNFIKKKFGKKYTSFGEYLKFKMKKLFKKEKDKSLIKIEKQNEEEKVSLSFLKIINSNLFLTLRWKQLDFNI